MPLPLRGRGHLAGVRARVADQFGDAFERHVRVDHQGIRHPSHDHDRHELGRVETELGIEVVVDHQRRRRRREQRVAVGLGLGDRLGADIAGRSGAVLDHDRLPPFARQPVGKDARHHVGGAAGRERHDDLDRTRGIVLRVQAGYRRKQSRRAPCRLRGQMFERDASVTTFWFSSRTTCPLSRSRRGDHSTLILAASTTGPQVSRLCRIMSRICSGDEPSGSASSARMRARISGVCSP